MTKKNRNKGTELTIKDTVWSNRVNPKLYNKEIIKRKNKHSLGGWFKNTTDNLSNWNTNVTNDLMGSKFGQGLSNLGIKSGNIGGIANTAATAIGGLIAGKNKTGVGTALQGIGSFASNIPGVGGLIGAGVNLAGGLVNATFGSNLNEEEIAKVEGQIGNLNSFTSNASDYDALASNYINMPSIGYFSKDDIGSDGWLSNKAEDKWEELKKEKEQAEQWVQNSLFNNAQNIATNKQQLLEANYTAYGGPINMKYTGTMSPFGNQFDDGGTAEKIYKMPAMQRIQYARTGRITNAGYPITPLGKGYKTMRALGRFRKAFKEKPWDPNGAFTSSIKGFINDAKSASDSETKKDLLQFSKYIYNQFIGNKGQNLGLLKNESEIKNEMKDGGSLFTNGVTIIGNGGTHEENPLEGVPMGIDQQGIPNLVEEGEVIFDDYVFSNRLRVPKDVRQKYKLRGTTFADAAKQLQKESEERSNDPISKNGLNASMTMLQQEQEAIRMKKESNKYAKGGKLGNLFDGTGPKSNKLIPGSLWYDTTPFTEEERNFHNILSYKDDYTIDWDKTYAPGSEFSNLRNYYIANWDKPFFKKFKENYISGLSEGNNNIDLSNFTLEDFKRITSDKKWGQGHVLDTDLLMDYLKNSEKVTDPLQLPSSADVYRTIRGLFGEPILNRNNTKVKDIPIVIEDEVVDEEPLPSYKGIEPMKDNWLRKLSVWMSGVAVANDLFGGNEPDYSNADLFARAIRGTNRQIGYRPIGNYLKYTPFDTNYYINKLDANTAAGRRAVMSTSGGNRAAALAGILATDYNYGNQLGDLARKAEEYNLDQRYKVGDYNRNTNIFNSEAGTKVDMFNAEQDMQRARMYGSLAEYRDKVLAANRAEKSANLTNFIQGLGNLGTELTDKDKLRWLAELGVLKYDASGKYTGDKKTEKANGGRINRKKRGGFTI